MVRCRLHINAIIGVFEERACANALNIGDAAIQLMATSATSARATIKQPAPLRVDAPPNLHIMVGAVRIIDNVFSMPKHSGLIESQK